MHKMYATVSEIPQELRDWILSQSTIKREKEAKLIQLLNKKEIISKNLETIELKMTNLRPYTYLYLDTPEMLENISKMRDYTHELSSCYDDLAYVTKDICDFNEILKSDGQRYVEEMESKGVDMKDTTCSEAVFNFIHYGEEE